MPDTVKSPPIVCPDVTNVWKLPVVKLAVVPVTVAPERLVVKVPVAPVMLLKREVKPVTSPTDRKFETVPVIANRLVN